MIKLTKVTDCQIDGATSTITIVGSDDAGNEVRIAMSADSHADMMARIKIAAFAHTRGTSPWKPGAEWQVAAAYAPNHVAVGIVSNDHRNAYVGLTFDGGSATEITFRLPARLAKQVGKRLVSTSEHLLTLAKGSA